MVDSSVSGIKEEETRLESQEIMAATFLLHPSLTESFGPQRSISSRLQVCLTSTLSKCPLRGCTRQITPPLPFSEGLSLIVVGLSHQPDRCPKQRRESKFHQIHVIVIYAAAAAFKGFPRAGMIRVERKSINFRS